MSSSEKPSTREKLVAATFRVVAREGLEAASVKAIAGEAGITPGLLHYYFPTKDALVEEAMRSALRDYTEQQAQPRSLDDFFEAARRDAEADRGYFRLRLAFAVHALNDERSAALIRELNREARETVAQALGGGEASERERLLAAALKAAFDGVMLAWLLDPDFPIDAAADFLKQGSRSWLNDQN